MICMDINLQLLNLQFLLLLISILNGLFLLAKLPYICKTETAIL